MDPGQDKKSACVARGEPSAEQIRAVLHSRQPRRIEPAAWKPAAVLVPIYVNDGRWHVLLTRRTHKVEHHKGEIAFPGGHYDAADKDLAGTALREAEEEVGILSSRVKVLGRLDDITTITGFRIRPFVGVIPYPFQVKVSDDEIAEVITLALFKFLEPGRLFKKDFLRDGRPYPVYSFEVDGCTVWGATARILKQFLELALGAP